MFYVYVYFNPLSLKDGLPEPFYVGKGSGNRCRIHLNESFQQKDKNKLKVNILRKIKLAGLEPIIEKVFESVNEELVKKKEADLIAEYGRRDLGLGPLANLTDGSTGVIQNTDTRKKKSIKSRLAHADLEIKKRRTAALKFTLSKPEIKKKYSDNAKEIGSRQEVIEKKRQSMLGVKNRAVPVEINGVYYESIRHACNVLGLNQHRLRKLSGFKRLK